MRRTSLRFLTVPVLMALVIGTGSAEAQRARKPKKAAATVAEAPVTVAPADLTKLDGALRTEAEEGSTMAQRVIITTKSGRRDAVKADLEAHGDAVTGEHASIGALSAEVHGDDLAALAQHPDVVRVSADAIVRAAGQGKGKAKGKAKKAGTTVADPVDSSAGTVLGIGNAPAPSPDAISVADLEISDPNLVVHALGLDDELGTVDGDGVRVAVIDSGLAFDKFDLMRIKGFYDFTQGDTPVPTAPYDDYGHGTHVAALIGNAAKKSDGLFLGVAPETKLYGFKVLDANGEGRTSDVIRAIEFAVANKDEFELDIVNLSLGHPIMEPAATDPLVQAVEAAVRAGLVVVVSAGNIGQNPDTQEVGYAGITSPGNAPSAITVGAVDMKDTASRADDIVPAFSSRGPTGSCGVRAS